MRVIFVLFDSLNRSALECYGGSISTPNFNRLAARSTIFDRYYVGSMPCMPARRDMHTGRLNFLHRSWGPIEVFDESFVISMRKNGIYTHLTSDHNHYFEDGGATYHNRYNTYDFIRGQESDAWVAMVQPPLERFQEMYHPKQFGEERAPQRIQGMINETRFKTEEDFPTTKCFDAAFDFLNENRGTDSWFLHLECFDPHEPFVAPESYRRDYQNDYDGPIYNWPQYRESLDDTPAEVAEIRANYAALVAFCDAQFGRLMDYMDAHEMWEDTAVVLTTDHGFMLGEHDWYGKIRMPFFNETTHIPLLIHDPRVSESWGTRNHALVQAIDLSTTFLDFFDLPPNEYSLGSSILPLLRNDVGSIRDFCLYGIFGGAINATDGQYTYFLYPKDIDAPNLFEYTLMPTHSTSLFEVRELQSAELFRGFNFTKGVPVLKVPALGDAKRPPMQGGGFEGTKTCLFDLETDPFQNVPLNNSDIEAKFAAQIIDEMKRHEAPEELYDRFGLTIRV